MTDCRQAAIDVALQLRRAGFEALLAGGCVRDELLGRTPKDWDVATAARPEDVRGLFRGARSVGEAFGVMLVRRSGCTVEVATFREDAAYGDHRRPDSVRFSNAEYDARRRDFTINGLYLDPESGDIIDHVGGRSDLEAGVLRAIGNPADRIAEDHLRMLRAVRFAAVLGFEIDPDTCAAIRMNASALKGVSPERVGEEFRRMLCSNGAARGMRLLADLGLDGQVPGAVRALGDQVRLEAAIAANLDWPARLAAVALDAGLGESKITDTWGPALVLSNAARDGACDLLQIVETLGAWETLSIAQQRRCAGRTHFPAGLCLHAVTVPDSAEAIGAAVNVWADTPGGVLPKRLVDGHALLEAGVPAGPDLGNMLEAVYDAQLAGHITSRQEGLELARGMRDGAT